MSELKKKTKDYGLYIPALLTKKVILPFYAVGKNIKENIQNVLSNTYEGKCSVEGYVKPGSIEIITYSSGIVQGSSIQFEVVIECEVCNPVEGMEIECIVKNITLAGIRAISADNVEQSPVMVFIARDHHYMNEDFNKVKEGSKIKVKIIGSRFELNDNYVSVIGSYGENKKKEIKEEIIEEIE